MIGKPCDSLLAFYRAPKLVLGSPNNWLSPLDAPRNVQFSVCRLETKGKTEESLGGYERCVGYAWASPVLLVDSKDMLVDVARHRSRSVVGHSAMVMIAPAFA